MTALKPVGINSVLSSSGSSVQSGAISQQSDMIRIACEGAGVHVAIGTNPTATADNFYATTFDEAKISLGPVASQRVVGLTTGSSTILDFPEGTGSPFGVGDAVTLTVTGQSDLDFEHKIVTSVDATSNFGGFYSTRITVDHDSSAGPAFNSRWAQLRKSFKVAVKTNSGTGTVFLQQVQVS